MHFLLLLLLLFSCSTESPSSYQTLSLNIYTEPPTIDPRKTCDIVSSNVTRMLFEGLTRIDSDNTPSLAIAKSVEISDNKKVYTFTLRKTKWSNGEPLTAHDFEYAWKQRLNPQFPSGYVHQLYVIKGANSAKKGGCKLDDIGVQAIDDYTLRVELEHPAPYFLELTSGYSFFPICRTLDQKDPEWALHSDSNFVSNGPFHLENWKHYNTIDIRKNPNYWAAEQVKLDTIHMCIVPDQTAELYMFDSGELDWVGAPFSHLPLDAIPSLQKENKLNVKPILGLYWYKFNTKSPPFDNAKMRKAFSYAINRKDIIKFITQTGETSATGPIPYRNPPFHVDGDKALAQSLFVEALNEMGISKEELPPIYLNFNSSDDHHKIAQVIQQQWNDTFDLHIHLENCEWQVHLSKMQNHDFQVGRLAWLADHSDPIHFLELFAYGEEETQWHSTEYQEIIEKALSETDLDARNLLITKAETLFTNEMPLAPIFAINYSYQASPDLHGVHFSNLGVVDFSRAFFTEHN